MCVPVEIKNAVESSGVPVKVIFVLLQREGIAEFQDLKGRR